MLVGKGELLRFNMKKYNPTQSDVLLALKGKASTCDANPDSLHNS